jgi:hypothetical protein
LGQPRGLNRHQEWLVSGTGGHNGDAAVVALGDLTVPYGNWSSSAARSVGDWRLPGSREPSERDGRPTGGAEQVVRRTGAEVSSANTPESLSVPSSRRRGSVTDRPREAVGRPTTVSGADPERVSQPNGYCDGYFERGWSCVTVAAVDLFLVM